MDHSDTLLLNSYNRHCQACRRAIEQIDEARARKMLAGEVTRSRASQIRINNAIAIWQAAAKRKNAGKEVRHGR